MVVGITLMQCMGLTDAHAAGASIVPPDPVKQGLPQVQRHEATPQIKPTATPSDEAVQTLATPIKRIDVQSPLLKPEIETLLKKYIGQTRIPRRDFETLRGQIWDMARRRHRLTRVDVRVLQQSEDNGGNVLQALVEEIAVRAVKVEQEGNTKIPSRHLDKISDNVMQLINNGTIDIVRLDTQIKRRMFLGDVSVHASLVPVPAEPNHVDLDVGVKASEPGTPAAIAQYDNNGMRTYGRSRYTLAASDINRITAGDKFDVTGMTSQGMNYARVRYELPVIPLGLRANAWGARTNYRAPSGIRGNSTQYGLGSIFPLWIDESTNGMGYLNYIHRHQADYTADGETLTGDKIVKDLQARILLTHIAENGQTLSGDMTITRGSLDLARENAVLLMDQISAKSNGTFTKIEYTGRWNALLGQEQRFDTRLEFKGQYANKNLDQSEKFGLGGNSGVRAFGAGEALGDQGHILNAEIGYRVGDTVRLSTYYDAGRIQRYSKPWTVDAIPNKYFLHGAGVGISASYKQIDTSFNYARQIGHNPGLDANGLDSDSLHEVRYRIWASLSYRF